MISISQAMPLFVSQPYSIRSNRRTHSIRGSFGRIAVTYTAAGTLILGSNIFHLVGGSGQSRLQKESPTRRAKSWKRGSARRLFKRGSKRRNGAARERSA